MERSLDNFRTTVAKRLGRYFVGACVAFTSFKFVTWLNFDTLLASLVAISAMCTYVWAKMLAIDEAKEKNFTIEIKETENRQLVFELEALNNKVKLMNAILVDFLGASTHAAATFEEAYTPEVHAPLEEGDIANDEDPAQPGLARRDH